MAGRTVFGTSMACPECGVRNTRVSDMRPSDHNQIRRRRICLNGHRFTTYENADGSW